MVGPRTTFTELTKQPLAASWKRDFRRFANNRFSSLSPVHEESELYAHGPITFGANRSMVWLHRGSKTGRGIQLIGVPEFRLAGMYAPANAEFTTGALRTKGARDRIWLSFDAHWTASVPDAPPPHHAAFSDCDEGCAAYVMVALLDAASGAVVPGFEKERCVHMNANEQRLHLLWQTRSPPPGTYKLRIYFRDAVVYATGVGVHGASGTKIDDNVSR